MSESKQTTRAAPVKAEAKSSDDGFGASDFIAARNNFNRESPQAVQNWQFAVDRAQAQGFDVHTPKGEGVAQSYLIDAKGNPVKDTVPPKAEAPKPQGADKPGA